MSQYRTFTTGQPPRRPRFGITITEIPTIAQPEYSFIRRSFDEISRKIEYLSDQMKTLRCRMSCLSKCIVKDPNDRKLHKQLKQVGVDSTKVYENINFAKNLIFSYHRFLVSFINSGKHGDIKTIPYLDNRRDLCDKYFTESFKFFSEIKQGMVLLDNLIAQL